MSEYTFALCFSHEIDRVYKNYQYLYQVGKRRGLVYLQGLLSMENPYW